MLGVFDSGRGGLTAIAEIRKIDPESDICFFADKKNAPYGTKSKKELIELVKNDIKRLSDFGADKILMACCTASTVHRYLPWYMQRISKPIIAPTAKEAARVTKSGKIGIIATEATVSSGSFSKELMKYRSVSEVCEMPTQELVTLVEDGVSDCSITGIERKRLERILFPVFEKDIDTLILGCTHFPHLEKEIGKLFPHLQIVNPSREGAKEMLKSHSHGGDGKTFYL